MKRQFLKEAINLFNDTKGRTVSGDILIHEWKSSEVWEYFDLIRYRLADEDKMPMMIWDSGEVISNKEEAKLYLLECYIAYAESALNNTKKLQFALEAEIASGKELLKMEKELQSFLNL